jgi:NAD(P)-dependent dehydrogenase (short-subunit alcohol dehydrogenase family)
MHWHDTEHPSIRAFALAPGMIPTRLAAETGASGSGRGDERADGDAELKRVAPDSVALPAATMLYLTSGRADWLSGRFVPLPLVCTFFHVSHTCFLMGLLGTVLRTGIWRRWSGIGET